MVFVHVLDCMNERSGYVGEVGRGDSGARENIAAQTGDDAASSTYGLEI